MKVDQVRLYRLSVVIEERNLSRAAERLGLSQPALSASLALFEQELGVRLLDRGRHGAVPTVFGAALYERSKVIESELKRAGRQIEELVDVDKGHLAVGATSGSAVTIVCLATARLLKRHPAVSFVLDEDWSEASLLGKVRRHELDLMISPAIEGCRDDHIVEEPAFETRSVIVVRSGHPALTAGMRDPSKFLEHPLVAPDDSHALRHRLNELFLRMGTKLPSVSVVANSLALAKQIVTNTDNFAVFTEVSVLEEIRNGSLTALRFPFPTEFWYHTLRSAQVSITPTAKIFLKELNAVCKSQLLKVFSP